MMRLAETFPALALPAPPGFSGFLRLTGFLGGAGQSWPMSSSMFCGLRVGCTARPQSSAVSSRGVSSAPRAVGGTSASPSSRSTAEVGSVPVMQ